MILRAIPTLLFVLLAVPCLAQQDSGYYFQWTRFAHTTSAGSSTDSPEGLVKMWVADDGRLRVSVNKGQYSVDEQDFQYMTFIGDSMIFLDTVNGRYSVGPREFIKLLRTQFDANIGSPDDTEPLIVNVSDAKATVDGIAAREVEFSVPTDRKIPLKVRYLLSEQLRVPQKTLADLYFGMRMNVSGINRGMGRVCDTLVHMPGLPIYFDVRAGRGDTSTYLFWKLSDIKRIAVSPALFAPAEDLEWISIGAPAPDKMDAYEESREVRAKAGVPTGSGPTMPAFDPGSPQETPRMQPTPAPNPR